MKSISILKLILPIIIIAIAVGSFMYLKSSQSERKKPQTKEKIWQVATLNVVKESLAADLTLYATIESPSLHTASAPAAGIVEEVLVQAGTHVKQGDVLLKLEQQDFINTANQTRADILDIKAQLLQLDLKYDNDKQSLILEQDLLTLSQAELNRIQSLKQRGLGSDSTLTDAKSALTKQQLAILKKTIEVNQYDAKKQQLNAKLKRLNAILNQSNLVLKRSVIVANFNGIISSVDVSQGDRVQPAQKLISLYSNQTLEAKTRIPAQFQQEVQIMLSKQQNVKATALMAHQKIAMQLDRMAGHSAANGTEVYFKITQGQEFLRVGNFLKLNVKREKQDQVIKLPLQALYGTSRIYVLDDERLKGVDVETVGHFRSDSGEQYILIRHSDIHNGDKIVTTHLPNAITGLKVKTSEK